MEKVIDYTIWCNKLPYFWKKYCGCNRTCNISQGLGDYLFSNNPLQLKYLFRYGYITVQGYVIRCVDKKCKEVVLYPWPKHMTKKLDYFANY